MPKKPQTLSARVEAPSWLLAPAELSRLCIAYLDTKRGLHLRPPHIRSHSHYWNWCLSKSKFQLCANLIHFTKKYQRSFRAKLRNRRRKIFLSQLFWHLPVPASISTRWQRLQHKNFCSQVVPILRFKNVISSKEKWMSPKENSLLRSRVCAIVLKFWSR